MANPTPATSIDLLDNPYVPDVKRRVAKMTPALKGKFCGALAEGASPTKAAQALGLARSTVYYQRGIDPDFKAAWEEALEQQADLYEDALRKAALVQGNIGGIIFGLKNLRPAKWKDKHEIVQSSVNVHVSIPAATEAELLAMVRDRLEQGHGLLPPPGSRRSTYISDNRGGDDPEKRLGR